MTQQSDHSLEKATFAGGCFWCMEGPFSALQGVEQVRAGYCGGNTQNPSYKEVCTGQTGHYEAVQIQFNPHVISYSRLLDVFWHQIDPTDPSGQFYDKGSQYKTAIFYHNSDQKNEAHESKEKLAASGLFDKPIVTDIIRATTFFDAEEYHQEYHVKSENQYKAYRSQSGRDQFLEIHWGAK
jgi:peptide methionine sulfoxide reductase msrA/msrB